MKDYLKPAQRRASTELSKTLQTKGLALLWGAIRSGKTRTFLEASKGYPTLVVTKKDSMSGILSEAKEIGAEVDVINYHSIHKKDPNDYKLIILDECHLYIASATPKHPPIWKEVVKFTRGKFCIFASGTPTPEGYAGLYRMLALSSWTPFPFKRFTEFFKVYGIPSQTYLGDRAVPCYKKTKVNLITSKIEPYVVRLNRKETGHKHEAKDVIHEIPLNKLQKKMVKKLEKKHNWSNKDYEILADTPVKLLTKLHQIAGGIAVNVEPLRLDNPDFKPLPKKKIKKMTDDELIAYDESKYIYKEQVYHLEERSPKIKYILDNFNPENTIILSYYKEEQEYLAKLFPHTGSVTKLSTGVDLSHFKTMVVFSMGFSSANYQQVRGRMMNINRKQKIKVHYLISGIDEYVLKAVKGKENFTSRWFKRNK